MYLSDLYSIREVKMKIEGLGNLLVSSINTTANKVEDKKDFGGTLSELVGNVNQTQKESQKAVQDFISGNGVELHEVMIAGAKAKTSLELLMELRNKTVDMYKELTRMPV